MPLRCDVIAMAPHDVTGHGGVRAARALGFCLLVCFVLGQETPVSGNSLGSDVTKTYSSTQSQGDASSGPRTRHQNKVPLWVWAHNLRAGTVTKSCKETLQTLP